MKKRTVKRALKDMERIDKGLVAVDFPKEGVKIVHDDGSIFKLCYAFYKEQKDGWFFVFTEHHSYLLFHIDDIKFIQNLVRR